MILLSYDLSIVLTLGEAAPLSTIAHNGKLTANLTTLKEELSPQDYDQLITNLQSLGHVGERHCRQQQ